MLNKNRKNKIFLCEQLYVSIIFFQKAITKLDTQGIRVRVRFSSARNGYSKLGLIYKVTEKIKGKNFFFKVRGKNFQREKKFQS